MSPRALVSLLPVVWLAAACGKGSSGGGATLAASTAPAVSSSPVVASGSASAAPSASAAAAPADMLPVPAGAFTMGADKGGEEDERPAHRVTLPGFWLDKTEVTHAQYAECVAAAACRPPSKSVAADYPRSQGPSQPVNGVSWDDAKAYCQWRGKRLPREAEFERAVRGDDARRFPWGDEPPTAERTVFGRSMGPGGSNTTDDVGSHPAGRGPYGHDDLAGNVWEWMEDEYDPYAYRRKAAGEGRPGSCVDIMTALKELRDKGRQGFTGTNPIPDECERSIRGGAFNYPAAGVRATNRVHHPGRFRIVMLGFRCAKD